MSDFDDVYAEILGEKKPGEGKRITCNDARAFSEEERAAWVKSLQGEK